MNGQVNDRVKFGLQFKTVGDGGYIIGDKIEKSKLVIFDLTTFDGFSDLYSDNEKLTIFNKVLKYAIRYWTNVPKTNRERDIANSSLTVVFPFPFTRDKAKRIVIDRSPDTKRDTARKYNNLLVFELNSGQTAISTPITNYRKALENLPSPASKVDLTAASTDYKRPNYYSVEELPENQDLVRSSLGFDKWISLLTESQHKFVFAQLGGPQRLDGAAGTGKTLSLILRCIFLVSEAIKNSVDRRIIFFTHSIATKRNIENILLVNDPNLTEYLNRPSQAINLQVTTLLEYCITTLRGDIAENQVLDFDAQESKALQTLYIEEALDNFFENKIGSFSKICSPSFIKFFKETPKEDIIEMLQHEFAVVIKGRAGYDLRRYKNIIRPKYSIPVINSSDHDLVYDIFKDYQSQLYSTGDFDTDDIVIETFSKLRGPIWDRNRKIDGFDAVFIDETHLFNFNELSLFHFLLKSRSTNNIIYAIDKSQAVGDRGIDGQQLDQELDIPSTDERNNHLNTVFRSSPAIVDLAYSVLASGASMFVDFSNPLEHASSSFTVSEENKSIFPSYKFYNSDCYNGRERV